VCANRVYNWSADPVIKAIKLYNSDLKNMLQQKMLCWRSILPSQDQSVYLQSIPLEYRSWHEENKVNESDLKIVLQQSMLCWRSIFYSKIEVYANRVYN